MLPMKHDQLQKAIVESFWYGRWDAEIFCVPNQQGTRNIIEQVRMMKLGILPGITDLGVIWTDLAAVAAGLRWTMLTGYLEVKPPKRYLSKSQRKFRDICTRRKGPHAIIRDPDELDGILADWGVPRKPRELPKKRLKNTP